MINLVWSLFLVRACNQSLTPRRAAVSVGSAHRGPGSPIGPTRQETVSENAIYPADICGRHPVTAPAWQPTSAELQAATARTAAAMADPAISPADRERAAELEAALYDLIEPGPCDRLTDPAPRESRVDWGPELEL
jgi:hypothetical protein